MSWEHFYMVCDSRIDLLELGRVCCLERKEAGMGLWIYLVGAGHLFQFYPRYVDFSGTSSDADVGETRLWYSFFLPLAGLITYVRWKYKWILSFSCILSLVFICINIFPQNIHKILKVLTYNLITFTFNFAEKFQTPLLNKIMYRTVYRIICTYYTYFNVISGRCHHLINFHYLRPYKSPYTFESLLSMSAI